MTVELHDDWLRVHADGFVGDFHYLWLRHNTDGDRHPQTGERIVDSSELDPDVRPVGAVEEDPEGLRIRWSDGATSRYPLALLREHAYALDRAHAPPPADVATVEVHATGDLETLAARALAVVRTHGLVIVRGDPAADPAAATEPLIQAFERQGLGVIETHFGRIEDLRPDNTTNANTDQLGYTSAGIDVHTDQPFLPHPPRWQLLQAIVPATHGGTNFLVDGQAAAAYFASIDEPGHALLTSVDVRFHRKQKAFERLVVAPIVVLDGPRGFQIRYSYFTLAPHRVPFARMRAWYRAYDAFARLVRDPRHQYQFALGRGDFVLYDNLRMLHGRTAFTGPRWLRGIYFDEPA